MIYARISFLLKNMDGKINVQSLPFKLIKKNNIFIWEETVYNDINGIVYEITKNVVLNNTKDWYFSNAYKIKFRFKKEDLNKDHSYEDWRHRTTCP